MPLIRHSEDNLEDAKEHLKSLDGDYMDVAKPTIIRLAWCLDEIDRLHMRDNLFSQLMEQVKEYYGGDGGLASLQDGHYLLRAENVKLLFFATTLAHYPCANPQGKLKTGPANCMKCGPCKSRRWEEGNG